MKLLESSTLTAGCFSLSKWKSQTQESARAVWGYAAELWTSVGQAWWKFSSHSIFWCHNSGSESKPDKIKLFLYNFDESILYE